MKNRSDDPVFALSYADLQEIHKLNGMVCGWHMSLPKVMIKQAKEVHKRMLALNQVKARISRKCCHTCGERIRGSVHRFNKKTLCGLCLEDEMQKLGYGPVKRSH